MKLLQKILVGTDFSATAADALGAARWLAKVFHSQIILIHVIPTVPESPLALAPLEEGARKQLRELEAAITQDGLRVGDSILAQGSPFDQILQAADLHDVNLIVVGSEPKPDEGMYRLGVTPERLVRKSDRPVWVVRPGVPPGLSRMLCAVDFSEPSRRALTNAIHLARHCHAELAVVTVVESLAHIYVSHPQLAVEAETKHLAQRRKEFDQFLSQFDLAGVSCTRLLRQGIPHREILHAVAEWRPELLLMGSVGRTGLARILLGSVAEKVVRELPCSILTVKAGPVIRPELETKLAGIEALWKQGRELLEKGFPSEALRQFEICLEKDSLYARAWEGLAAAHERLGHPEQAQKCKERARRVREHFLEKRIEAEVRAKHPLWPKS
jgi:universal stress protein E